MPNSVRISRRVKYVEYSCYILLLCFIIPVKIENKIEIINQKYEEYIRKFNKSYDEIGYQRGLQAFKKSLKDIDNFNLDRPKPSSAHYGLTKYSDMLPEDFLKSQLLPNLTYYLEKSSRMLSRIDTDSSISKRSVMSDLPPKVDWRGKNVVTEVENQGSCGACWAFAAVGITESMYAIMTGHLEKLSIQEMIDCSSNNFGCEGGDVYSLLQWIKTNNVTIAREKDYPLMLVKEKCRHISNGGVQITEFECGSMIDSEDVIVQLVAEHGPVAVAINAQSWQNYVTGTIQFHCDNNSTKLNHAVQIVGYDLTAEIPHYIVKNSWGEDFGDNGYLYIAIGGNLCGLAREVCAVNVL